MTAISKRRLFSVRTLRCLLQLLRNGHTNFAADRWSIVWLVCIQGGKHSHVNVWRTNRSAASRPRRRYTLRLVIGRRNRNCLMRRGAKAKEGAGGARVEGVAA